MRGLIAWDTIIILYHVGHISSSRGTDVFLVLSAYASGCGKKRFRKESFGSVAVSHYRHEQIDWVMSDGEKLHPNSLRPLKKPPTLFTHNFTTWSAHIQSSSKHTHTHISRPLKNWQANDFNREESKTGASVLAMIVCSACRCDACPRCSPSGGVFRDWGTEEG